MAYVPNFLNERFRNTSLMLRDCTWAMMSADDKNDFIESDDELAAYELMRMYCEQYIKQFDRLKT